MNKLESAVIGATAAICLCLGFTSGAVVVAVTGWPGLTVAATATGALVASAAPWAAIVLSLSWLCCVELKLKL